MIEKLKSKKNMLLKNKCNSNCEYFKKRKLKRRNGLLICFLCIIGVFLLTGYIIIKYDLNTQAKIVSNLYPQLPFTFALYGAIFYLICDFIIGLIFYICDYFRS